MCLFVGLPRYKLRIDLGDEGFLAHSASRVLEGQMPNRDFFSLQPPLCFYTSAAFFKCFGVSLASLRILGLCLYVAIAVLVYLLARSISNPVLSLVAAMPAVGMGLPYFDFVPFAVWHGTTFSLLASVLIIGTFSKGCRWLAIAAGLATALAVLSRHDQAFYLIVSILLFGLLVRVSGLGLDRPSGVISLLGFWVLGCGVPLVVLAILWGICGSIPRMFIELVVFPITKYAGAASLPIPWFSVGSPLYVNCIVLLYYAPVVLGVAVLVRLGVRISRRRIVEADLPLLFLAPFTLLYYCQVLARSDLHHLLPALGPFFAMLGWLLQSGADLCSRSYTRVTGQTGRIKAISTAAVALVAIALGGFFWSPVKQVFCKPLLVNPAPIDLPRAGIWTEKRVARDIKYVIRRIHALSPSDRSILCLPYHPMTYFLSERRNPTNWSYLWYRHLTDEDGRTMVDQARSDPPSMCILVGDVNSPHIDQPIIEFVREGFGDADKLEITRDAGPWIRQHNEYGLRESGGLPTGVVLLIRSDGY